MLAFPGSVRIFVCLESADLRKGFEGLSAMTEKLFPRQLLTGAYFAFFNNSGNQMKVLYWDVDGLAIWNKRLEKGTFCRKSAKEQMDRRDFLMLLEGIRPMKKSARFFL